MLLHLASGIFIFAPSAIKIRQYGVICAVYGSCVSSVIAFGAWREVVCRRESPTSAVCIASSRLCVMLFRECEKVRVINEGFTKRTVQLTTCCRRVNAIGVTDDVRPSGYGVVSVGKSKIKNVDSAFSELLQSKGSSSLS